MVKKYNSALVPTPVSSSDEELSDSERDVSDTESGDSDTGNDVADSDSEDVDSENDVVEEEEEEDEAEDEEGTEAEQPIGLLKKSTAGASSSKALAARASSSKALAAKASSSKALAARASYSKALAARASSSKAPAARASSSKAPAAGSSSSEAQTPESDSETESDMDIQSVSSPDSDGFAVRQIVVKPEKQEDVAETLRRRRGKQPARPSGSEVEKRRKGKKKRVDDIEGAERKKKKKEADGGVPAGKPEKRRRFQRLWSEEDEIALLKGLGEYERRSGKNPFYEMGKFSEFIKKSIKIKVTARQLVDKARRLRRKFVKNVSRSKDGKDPIFKRLHDRRSFEVSKAVWGDGKLNVRPYCRGRPSETEKTAAASRKRKRAAIKKGKAPRKTQLKKKGGGGGNGNGGGGNDNGAGGNGNGSGVGNGNGSGVGNGNGNGSGVGNGNGNGGDFWSRYPSIRDSVDIFPYLPEWGRNLMMERLVRNTPVEKLNELEFRWKELRDAVSELHVRHLQLLKETMMLPEEAASNRQ